MNEHIQAGVLVLSLVGMVALFYVGGSVFLQGVPDGILTDFELYALAFTTGAWSTMTVIFALNYVSVYRWERVVVSFDPRFR